MENLVIEIGANTREFLAGIREVGDKTEDLGDRLKGVGVVATAAFAGYTASIMASVYAYREEEKIGQEVNAILKATGGIAGITAEAVEDLAAALSKQTTFSRESVARGEEILLTYTRIGKDVFPSATEATLDLAQRMGGDASGAAQVLGRALQDPMQGLQQLRRAGILFTESQKAQIETMQLSGNVAGAQRIILAQIESQYGGMAKAAAGGTGAVAQLKNTMEQLTQGVGKEFAPIIQSGAMGLNKLLQAASQSEGFKTLTAGVLGTGAAVTGLISSAAGGALALNQLVKAAETAKLVMTALGISIKAAVGATGIGLLLIVAAEVYAHWDVIWPAVQGVFMAFVKHTGDAAKALGLILMGAFTMNVAGIKAGIDAAAKAFAEGMSEVRVSSSQVTGEAKNAAEKAGRELANTEAKARQQALLAEENRTNSLRAQAQKVGLQAMKLELEHHSSELVQLKRKEADLLSKLADSHYRSQFALLQKSLKETQAEYAREYKAEEKAKDTFEKNYLKTDKRFSSMKEADQQAFILKHEQSLTSMLQDESSAQEAVLAQDLQKQIESNNARLQDQARFGSAYASINAAMNSSVLVGSASSFSQLEQLSQSHNQTLKTIGKGSASVSVALNAAKGAMSAYAGFVEAFGPFGVAPGILAAAAVVAYGIEQEQKIWSAANGGLMVGGVPGVDSIPTLTQHGELVAPAQSYEEVVSSVAAQRMAKRAMGDAPSGQSLPSQIKVVVELKGNASRILQVWAVQDKAMGIYRGT